IVVPGPADDQRVAAETEGPAEAIDRVTIVVANDVLSADGADGDLVDVPDIESSAPRVDANSAQQIQCQDSRRVRNDPRERWKDQAVPRPLRGPADFLLLPDIESAVGPALHGRGPAGSDFDVAGADSRRQCQVHVTIQQRNLVLIPGVLAERIDCR